jgi:hypothetical protein
MLRIDRDVREVRLNLSVALNVREPDDLCALASNDARDPGRCQHSVRTLGIRRKRWPALGFAEGDDAG